MSLRGPDILDGFMRGTLYTNGLALIYKQWSIGDRLVLDALEIRVDSNYSYAFC
jgi:hypothetical protein